VKLTVVAGDVPQAATLALAGEFDLATTGGFEEKVDELVEAGVSHLTVDLSELTFCDSVGLNGLVRSKQRCEERGGWLRVSGARGQVAHVIGVAGLLGVLAADD
jgi:anti-anti-sigma factor